MFTGSHASFGGKWWKVWNVWMPTLRVTGYRHGRLRAGTQKWRWKRIFLFNWVIFSWRVIFSFQRLVLRGVWIGLNRCCWNGTKKKISEVCSLLHFKDWFLRVLPLIFQPDGTLGKRDLKGAVTWEIRKSTTLSDVDSRTIQKLLTFRFTLAFGDVWLRYCI